MQITMCSDAYLLITKNILSKRTSGWELKKAHAWLKMPLTELGIAEKSREYNFKK